MHLTSIKNAKDTGLKGVEFIFTDKAITEIVIGKVRIRKSENYGQSLSVFIETPHICEDRFRVTGKVEGFPNAVSYWSSEYDANNAASELRDRGALADVEKVRALIDENGDVVGIEGTPEPDKSDMPF